MRKIAALFLVLIGIFFFLMKQGEQAALNSIPQNTLVVFSKTGCYHCHDALAFIDKTVKKQYPDLPISVLDVDKDNNLARLLALAKKNRISYEKLGTPVLFLNGKILIGWAPEYDQRLLAMIRSSQNATHK